MPVVFQEQFEKKLREWSSQPDPNPPDYELFPTGIGHASLKIDGIDGLLWETTPRTDLDFVAGRFRRRDLEQKWIISHKDMEKIPGGSAEVSRLSSALVELGERKLRALAVETKDPSGKTYVAITVSEVAQRLIDDHTTALAGSRK
ncbi:hypothetical protein PISL3812_09913 [Talaromyces islandicus]|uniref:Uncharacterized protein n=1 Tax=Talaromyces islandicus TaxID=28573 RepID=A0A0U1MBY8_TALIS|nr:hypothetical protein PISL3812_09913 [Talaromyces islandicus]